MTKTEGARSPVDVRVSEAVARWWLLVATATPLVWLPVYYPTVVPKAVFFRALVTVAVAAWGYRWAVTGESGISRRDPVFWALGGLVTVGAASAVMGSSPLYSLFGGMERMWGVTAWAHLLGFYVVARAVFDDCWWRRCVAVLAGVGTLLALHQVGQVYSPELTPDVRGVRGAPAATLGNVGYVAGYLLVSATAATLLLRAASSAWARVGWGLSAVLALWGLYLTGSRAALIGYAVTVCVAVPVYGLAREERWVRRAVLGLLVAGTGVAVGFLLSPSLRSALGSPLGLGAAPLSEAVEAAVGDRLVAWKAALQGILQKPFLGFGPENFGVVFDRYFDPAWYDYTGDQPWDRAHNAFLEPFATMGVLGGGAYLGLWGGALWKLCDGWRSDRLSDGELALWTGLITGYAAFLFFWFEDLSGFVLFLTVLGWGMHRSAAPADDSDNGRPPVRGGWRKGLLAAGLAAGVVVTVNFQWDYLRSGRATQLAQATENLREASRHYDRAMRERPPGEIVVPSTYARMVYGLFPQIRSMPREERPLRTLRETAASSRAAIAEAVRENPEKSRLRIRYAGVLMTSFVVEEDREYLRRAIEETERAVGSAPNRVTYYHTLASLYDLWGSPKAVLTAAREAQRLYGDMPETYVHLARGHHGMGEEKLAYSALLEAVRRGAGVSDSTLVEGILRATPDSGRAARRDSLCAYMDSGPGAVCGR